MRRVHYSKIAVHTHTQKRREKRREKLMQRTNAIVKKRKIMYLKKKKLRERNHQTEIKTKKKRRFKEFGMKSASWNAITFQPICFPALPSAPSLFIHSTFVWCLNFICELFEGLFIIVPRKSGKIELLSGKNGDWTEIAFENRVIHFVETKTFYDTVKEYF